jgi:voltage-gated potassium channel Kch
VVVCGLGPVGARLAAAFRDAGDRVVAIEPDAGSSAVHDSRASGIVVLVGDPADRGLLVKAGVLSARYLVIASGDDGRKADVALAAGDVVASRRRPLPCFVHVVGPDLSGLLGESTLVAGGSLRLDFFNPEDAVPPMVLDEFPPAGAATIAGALPHMLVVGPGRLGGSW